MEVHLLFTAVGTVSLTSTAAMFTVWSVQKVYGVVWEEDEDAYGLYNGWQDTEKQLLDMLLFDGVKGLDRCCEQ